MRHKEWKMGTMVERIQPVGPSNLLNNMVQVFTNTGNTPPPSNLQTPFGARHESTALCKWGVLNPKKIETTTHSATWVCTQLDLHRFTHHWTPPPLPSS